MLFASSSSMLALLLGLASGANDVTHVPRLEVQVGNVRVFAREAWLSLAPGECLPQSQASSVLSLDWNARARLTLSGAGVELRGPLEVESNAQGEWTVRVSGSGQIQVDARRAAVNVELEATASMNLISGVYWAEGLPDGGWRVGCDGGEALSVRPPTGSGWHNAPRIESGTSLRIVPTGSKSPRLTGEIRRPSAAPWKSFSWPWSAAERN